MTEVSTSSRMSIRRGATRTSERISTSIGQESTTGQFVVTGTPGRQAPSRNRGGLESAVYSYIRAVRALKRTRITVSEIAEALAIPESEVFSVLEALRKKGVIAL